jgi:hypothetical protein
MKKSFILLLILCSFFISCNPNSKQNDKKFVSCTYDEGEDQLILSNSDGTYKLSIWLYGKQIEPGEYQVLGSDQETELEGKFLIDNITRDVKTTLFINYADNKIKVWGLAQLYKPDSIQNSGEIVDFSYEGKLTKK